MKKVIIIGAGISGLTAGIYARKSGFDVTIMEKQSYPGGSSACWQKNGFIFESGMHWLTGSSEHLSLHRLWEETSALNSSNPIIKNDALISFQDGDKFLTLYRDAGKTKEHFLTLAPQCKKMVSTLYRDMILYRQMNLPINDLRGVKVQKKYPLTFFSLLKMLPAIFRSTNLGQISIDDYLAKFNDQGIRTLLSFFGEKEASADSLLFTLGSLAAGDGGYPKGGSCKMAHNMAEEFISLKGTLLYQTPATQIIDEPGHRISGVKAADKIYPADAVIVTSDILKADHLFTQPLNESWMKHLRQHTHFKSATFIGLGLKGDYSHLPDFVLLSLDKPLFCAGETYHILPIANYSAYKGYAPTGHSTLTMILSGDTYDYWQQAKENGNYAKKKKALAKDLINRLGHHYPQMKNQVLLWDVATPLTYERFCGTYRGSWRSILKTNKEWISYPAKSKKIKGLYFAGQRMQPPGGLAAALNTGRAAVQYLCKDYRTLFCNQQSNDR